MLLNELTDGIEIDQVLLVRESERRQRRDGGDYLRLQLGDRTGAVACMVWEELGRGGRARPRRRSGQGERPLHGASPLRARRSTCATCRRPRPGALIPPSCSTARRARSPRWKARCASWWRRSSRPSAHPPRAGLRRGLRAVGPLPGGPGGEVLPPGLQARSARAQPGGRPGRQHDQRHLPGHRSRRGRDRCAAARHRQARGLHR